ncbi:MAG: NUDIX domain-containing protein [Nanoarchaeota archaeon]
MEILENALRNAKRIEAAVVLPYTAVPTAPSVLLQKKDEGYPWHPLAWGFFGGQVEAREPPVKAVIRECLEEWGRNVNESDLLYLGTSPFADTHPDGVRMRVGLHHAYALPVSDPKDFLASIRLTEGAGFALFQREEISGLYMPTHNKFIVNKLFNKLAERK